MTWSCDGGRGSPSLGRRRWCASLVFSIVAVVCFGWWSSCQAQLSEDVQEFLRSGQECYQRGDLVGAQLEFENVLLLDTGNFEARLWLTQVYADRKNIDKAQQMLRLVHAAAPEHPRVLALRRLLRYEVATVSVPVEDMVVYETMTLLGSGTRLRPYGLVVPERRVRSAEPQEPTASFDQVALVPDDPTPEDPIPELDDMGGKSGPLAPALEAWHRTGLEEGLKAYFEIVVPDRSLGAEDDEGLLAEGMKVFQARLAQDENDKQARYFIGMIQFCNGQVSEAGTLLQPIRAEADLGPQLARVAQEIDQRAAAEAARLAAIKLEEERQEKERQDRLAQAQAASIAANLAPKATDGSGTASGSQGAPSASTEALHGEGYELYKKGQLDAAIGKFEEAIKGKADEPKYFYHMGLALTDKGLAGDMRAFDQAIDSFKQVIALDQESKMAKDAQVMIRDIIAAKNSLMR